MTDYTPTEQETTREKVRLIDLVQPQLKEHGLVDLTAFINNNSKDEFKHSGFVRSLAYRIEEMGIAEAIPRNDWSDFYIKRNIFSKRHPYIFAALLGTIGLVFSIIVGTTNAIVSSALKSKDIQKQLQQLEQKQRILYDDVNNLRDNLKVIQDTLLKYRR